MTLTNRKEKKSSSSSSTISNSTISNSSNHKKEIKYEFFGPYGPILIITSLPFVILGLYALCTDSYCLQNPFTFPWGLFLEKWFSNPNAVDSSSNLSSLISQYQIPKLFSFNAFLFFAGWFFFNVFLERILPGENVLGTVIHDKKKDKKFQLNYVLSGHLQFWVLLTLLILGYPKFSFVSDNTQSNFLSLSPRFEGFQPLPLDYIYDNYYQIAGSAIVFSFIMSVFL